MAKRTAAANKAASKKTATKKRASTKRAPARKSAESDNGAVNLVIVESPSKAKTIEKYLRSEPKKYKVIASVGHIIDLPTKTLGVDIENGFEPQYEVIRGKKKIVDNLKAEARKADRVYLAPDPDREGEAIAWHIAQVIGNGKPEIHRAVFNEITKPAIRHAIENPTDLNVNLFNAQQARRILDRLVGYKISPLLWNKVRRGLSAGRVQSVSMRLICDREREIRAFVPEEYWSIEAVAHADRPPPFEIHLAKIAGKDPKIANEKAASGIVEEVKGRDFVIDKVIKKEVAKRPFAPFITSTLQQEASRKLRFTARRTMRMAQRLYEGVEIGQEGPTGLITYMRTDSTRLSDTALGMIRGYIEKNYDKRYLPEKPRSWASKKSAQDAHEAIRPTNAELTPAKAAPYLDKDLLALYTLIWNRTMASQMADARLERTRIEIPVGRCLFVATGSVVKFNGFLAIYEEGRDESGKTESDTEGAEPLQVLGDEPLPPVEEGQRVEVRDLKGNQHFTQPPPRFTEAGLIKELEKQGIGRPSTYAQIISTIQDREYAVKDKGTFRPTDLGFIITDLLVGSFPQIMDVKFTALMENQLDEVEEGKVDWVELLNNFYQPFAQRLETAQDEMRNLKAEQIPTDYTCDKCGSPMVVRWGRNGQFLACSAYPDCRNTKPVETDEEGNYRIVEDKPTEHKCPNCGSTMVIKAGRRGRFLACSAYPECKTSRPIPIGIACPRPGCDGELVERQSRGRTFYSCSAYPNCRFAVNEIPHKEYCEVCGEEHHVVGKGPRAKTFNQKSPECPYPVAWSARHEPADDAEAKAGARGRTKKAPARKSAGRR